MTRLDKLPKPPLPEIDEEATAHTNEVLRAARARMPEFDVTRKLTLADCVRIASEEVAEVGSDTLTSLPQVCAMGQSAEPNTFMASLAVGVTTIF